MNYFKNLKNKFSNLNSGDQFAVSMISILIFINLGPVILLFFVPSLPKEQFFSAQKGIYEIVSIDPPKHLYLSFKEIETDKIYSSIYISKHWNNWKHDFPIGRKFPLTKITYVKENGEYYEKFYNISSALQEEIFLNKN